MNRYRVWYSYTEPSCDCPYVLVTGDNLYIDVNSKSHKAAKDNINHDSYLNRMHENLKVLRSSLLEKDAHLLSKVEIKGVKHKQGLGASFMIEGEEVAIVARSEFQLQVIGETIFGEDFVLNKDKLKPVNITAQR